MAESDEWATVETVVEDADSNPDRVSYSQAPGGIEQSILTTILSVLSSTNPWLLFFIVVGVYYLLQKFYFSRDTSSTAYQESLSPDEFLARQEAIEIARRRMQEQYDEKARVFAAKQKEKEELMRQEKLKNLEKYGTKLGRSSKTLAAEANEQAQPSLFKKKSEKSSLRPEYNPLMGGGGDGVCFRPSRRGGGAGGG